MKQEYVKAVAIRSLPYIKIGKVYDLFRGDGYVTEPDHIVGEDGSLCYLPREFKPSPHLLGGYFVECDQAGNPTHVNPYQELPIDGLKADEGVEFAEPVEIPEDVQYEAEKISDAEREEKEHE